MFTPTPGGTPRAGQQLRNPAPDRLPHTLLDAMEDGFHMLSLLRTLAALSAQDGDDLQLRIKAFFKDLNRDGTAIGASAEDVDLCIYAFCASVDEIMLQSGFDAGQAWKNHPLQLQLFGDQLAGLKFFDKLEALRRQGAERLQVLEVFHMCLLMGFLGKYVIAGKEELGFLTTRLGVEIAHFKGATTGFAPHAIASDGVVNRLRNEVSPWLVGGVFLVLGGLAFGGLSWRLNSQTRAQVASYNNTIKQIVPTASITITLP